MIYELLEDLREVLVALPKSYICQPLIKAILGALDLSAHVLAGDPIQLQSQVHGRLVGNRNQQVVRFLRAHQSRLIPSWLRTLDASLVSPDGKLVRTLKPPDWAEALPVVSPSNGNSLIYGAVDGTLRVLDVATNRPITSVDAHRGAITHLAASDNSGLIASASNDNVFKIWHFSQLHAEVLFEGKGNVQRLSIARDGSIAVFWLSDNTVFVWRTSQTSYSIPCPGYLGIVFDVAIMPDHKNILSASAIIVVSDAISGKTVARLTTHRGQISGLAISPDGTQLASSCFDGTIKLWDTISWKERLNLEGHSGGVVASAWLPDGRHLVSVGGDDALIVWDTVQGSKEHSIRLRSSEPTGLTLLHEGAVALVKSEDRVLKLWNLQPHTHGIAESSARAPISAIGMNAKANLALLAGNHHFTLRQITTSREFLSELILESKPSCLQINESGSIVESLCEDGFRVNHLKCGDEFALKQWPNDVSVCAAAASTNGQWMCTLLSDGAILVWNTKTNSCEQVRGFQANGEVTLAVDNQGQYLVVFCTGPDPPIFLDYLKGLKLPEPTTTTKKNYRSKEFAIGSALHLGALNSVQPNLRRQLRQHLRRGFDLAYAVPRRYVAIWERLPHPLGKTSSVWMSTRWAAFSAAGQWTETLYNLPDADAVHAVILNASGSVAIAWSDATMGVLDFLNGHYREIGKHDDEIVGIRPCCNGRIITSASHDRTLRMWNIEAGALQTCFTADSAISCFAIDPDGRLIMCAEESGILHTLTLVESPSNESESHATVPIVGKTIDDFAWINCPSVSAGQGESMCRETIQALNESGITLEAAGELSAAAKAFFKAFRGSTVTFGPTHPWTLASFRNLRNVLLAAGQEQAITSIEREACEDHSRIYKLRRDSNEEMRNLARAISPEISHRVLAAFKDIIGQIERKKKVAPYEYEFSPGYKLKLDIKLTPESLEADLEWMSNYAEEVVGGGVLAVHRLLGGTLPIQDIASAVLLFDLCNNVTFPFGARPKHSLLALSKVSQAVNASLRCLKLKSMSSVLSVHPPFMTHCRDESFVLVTGIDGKLIKYLDFGVQLEEDGYEFIQESDGFLLVPSSAIPSGGLWQEVPDPLAAFAWG